MLPFASCFKRPKKQILLLTCIASSLTACGGGGGGSDDNQTGAATSVSNRAPSIQAIEPVSVLEGSQISVSVVSNDPDGDPFSKTIDGADASFFNFGSDGAIHFSTLPDWEAAEDSDSDNVFEVKVTVSDGQQSASTNLEVTLTDALEGSAVIGVIRDSTVFIDSNQNSVLDQNEESAKSNEQGAFFLPLPDEPENAAFDGVGLRPLGARRDGLTSGGIFSTRPAARGRAACHVGTRPSKRNSEPVATVEVEAVNETVTLGWQSLVPPQAQRKSGKRPVENRETRFN